jgi:hypothetical protein
VQVIRLILRRSQSSQRSVINAKDIDKHLDGLSLPYEMTMILITRSLLIY